VGVDWVVLVVRAAPAVVAAPAALADPVCLDALERKLQLKTHVVIFTFYVAYLKIWLVVSANLKSLSS
jgi:hypothetical protein